VEENVKRFDLRNSIPLWAVTGLVGALVATALTVTLFTSGMITGERERESGERQAYACLQMSGEFYSECKAYCATLRPNAKRFCKEAVESVWRARVREAALRGMDTGAPMSTALSDALSRNARVMRDPELGPPSESPAKVEETPIPPLPSKDDVIDPLAGRPSGE